MALQNDFPDNTGGTCEDAYILFEREARNYNKGGRIELAVWKSKSSRENGFKKINNVTVTLGVNEIEAELFDNSVDPPVSKGIYTAQAKYADFAIPAFGQCYSNVKDLKLRVGDEIVLLNNATDI